jgi:hypothetical protein
MRRAPLIRTRSPARRAKGRESVCVCVCGGCRLCLEMSPSAGGGWYSETIGGWRGAGAGTLERPPKPPLTRPRQAHHKHPLRQGAVLPLAAAGVRRRLRAPRRGRARARGGRAPALPLPLLLLLRRLLLLLRLLVVVRPRPPRPPHRAAGGGRARRGLHLEPLVGYEVVEV